MWIRKRLDIDWQDLFLGISQCFVIQNRLNMIHDVQQQWSNSYSIFPCLSVRTGFDLLLDILQFPVGSEILVSSITIPDMIRIIEKHGLIPVPLDLTIQDVRPTKEQIEAAINPSTRAIMIAHLFGNCLPIDDIVELSEKNNLFLIEDYAQTFTGCISKSQKPKRIEMYSFGLIKTATALGGGILVINDASIYKKMLAKYETYPSQNRWSYFLKLLKCSFLKFITYKNVFKIVIYLCKILGKDYDRLLF
jgi:dTDP-4-amino-4,6-dideoxygalactose transaminase